MTRATVRADLAEMVRYYDAAPDQLPLYRDELVEAENLCAQCKHVGRSRRWRALGRHRDAPRLFCANVSLFEELTSDLFWTVIAPGPWHGGIASSPLLRLLAETSSSTSDDRSDLRTSKLRAMVKAAFDVDTIIDEWAPAIEAAASEQDAECLRDQLDSSIHAAIDNIDGISIAEFQNILQIALCDPVLAQQLCRLVDARPRKTTEAINPATK